MAKKKRVVRLPRVKFQEDLDRLFESNMNQYAAELMSNISKAMDRSDARALEKNFQSFLKYLAADNNTLRRQWAQQLSKQFYKWDVQNVSYEFHEEPASKPSPSSLGQLLMKMDELRKESVKASDTAGHDDGDIHGVEYEWDERLGGWKKY